ncbi:class I SAM-dependent rRNA methyltransferase [uncultured Winogradskyella sp.]|uniref:class I SAM-dependent rRNA methyltransferase n=1 Tax=uncultured Winogradskyella sp. TaxID=395353 RepID=UPI003513B13D
MIPKANRLAIKLTSRGERYVKQGHPWVFSDAIIKIGKDAKTGDLAVIFDRRNNQLIGLGLYDADSPIRIKILHSGSDNVKIDNDFFRSKTEAAFKKRLPLLSAQTNSFRLIFGENDGFPGLIVDVYNQVVVVKLYSGIWLPYFSGIISSIQALTNSQAIVLRLSRQMETNSNLNLKDGQVLSGVLEGEEVYFKEYNVQFKANVIKGHKTGFFLDHRENRRQVGLLSKGKTVLDVFAYAGGFAIHALVNGATEVTSVDISQKALEVAKSNANLNNFIGTHHTICGDAFTILEQLKEEGKTFDVVVIDPPSFAKQKSEIQIAKKKYRQLAQLGLDLTAPNGLLVLASCSSRVSSKSFFDINKNVLDNSQRPYNLFKTTGHDTDHPTTFPEAQYLKCAYYRFKD